jgi:uncharacterized Zn finger protein
MARWDRYDRYSYWPRYVPVAERRAKAARELARRAKRGQVASPIVIEGRTIASSFWGKAWCDNLERYSDFSNRLPRGRTYVRNGSVVDLQISAGSVQAMVSGSNLYEVQVRIAAVRKARWDAVCKDCAGAIDSLVELLQGRFSKGVMARICERDKGLFPSPKEIEFDCSCPDYASMCKHIAAVLYGIGARLDTSPELLFALRGVDHFELISQAGQDIPGAQKAAVSDRVLAAEDLSSMFDIELDATPAPAAAPAKPAERQTKKASAPPPAQTKNGRAARPAKKTLDEPAIHPAPAEPGNSAARPRPKKLSSAARKALTRKMKAKWAALRDKARRGH